MSREHSRRHYRRSPLGPRPAELGLRQHASVLRPHHHFAGYGPRVGDIQAGLRRRPNRIRSGAADGHRVQEPPQVAGRKQASIVGFQIFLETLRL